jgi:hypothetical protein
MAALPQAHDPVIASNLLADLPAPVATVLQEFTQALLTAAAGQTEAIILFGSAAEGRLRSTSDVNLLVIATELTMEQLDAIRMSLRAGAAAVGLAVMFLDSRQIGQAFEAFAVKFSDIKERHRVLFGRSPLDSIQVSRDAALRRLRQVLLNLILRLRERYAMDGDHEESLVRTLADVTGPLRASAAVLLALRDGRNRTPKAALEEFCAGDEWRECLAGLSAVHRGESLRAGAVRSLFSDVLRLLALLDAGVNALS